MAFKQFALNEHTTVNIYKRRGSRSLRLTIGANGLVRVTIPAWAPYSAGLEFARSRESWIAAQQPKSTFLRDGQAIGKAHHLRFVPDEVATKPAARVKTNEIVVVYPPSLPLGNALVQAAAQKASVRALRLQAEALLPQRLQTLASRHGFDYHSVSIKQLKRRWGSCDTHKNIVLNLYLMQLPWDCIDYVLLHELTHTRVLHHGPDFWAAMERVLPGAKQIRKIMNGYQPVLQAGE